MADDVISRYPDLPRPEAPQAIATVRDFVNTDDLETGIDLLVTAVGLSTYLRDEGLLAGTARASRRDLEQARELRAGLRAALVANHDGSGAPVEMLGPAVERLELRLTWGEDGPRLEPSRAGVAAALARIGIAAYEAARDGTWPRLKICSSDACEWAYFDHSKNQSRRWCEYGCGNRAKSRALRERRRAAL
ncbi:CGNR zinc finger domain-containing protein [Nocardioides aestuarii]|uniref:CGNR zinc finger domain-containing protein n=1 Tax=Nocardioides aestuarii TaxID=252231 RepID=A0ABW4TMP9_9ACTN